MRLVVLGPPGAGKGTQARNLSKYYSTPHVSTGDILREQMRLKTQIGLSIQELMDKGDLVPDEIVARLIARQLSEGSFILDGYPRTLAQAHILTYLTKIMGLPLDKVISISVSDETIIERMSGRVSCEKCGEIYHTFYYPPKNEGVCGVCGGKLVQREDDKALTVKNRLKVYHEMTEPIIKFYEEQGLLLTVSGIGEIHEITRSIITELDKQDT